MTVEVEKNEAIVQQMLNAYHSAFVVGNAKLAERFDTEFEDNKWEWTPGVQTYRVHANETVGSPRDILDSENLRGSYNNDYFPDTGTFYHFWTESYALDVFLGQTLESGRELPARNIAEAPLSEPFPW